MNMHGSHGAAFAVSIGLLVISTMPSLSAEKPTCAVLPFRPSTGCTKEDAEFISDRYTASLSQLDTYTLVTRSDMKEILVHQKVNIDFCATTENATEVGKMLSVQYVIFGSVGHFDDLYSMNTSLVEVETGKVINSAATDSKGGIADFITSVSRRNIITLLRVKNPPDDWEIVPVVPPPPPPDEETTSWFKRNWGYVAAGGAIVAGGIALGAGGGGGDGGGGNSGSLSGTWTGVCSGQILSTLKLSQSGSSVSGSLHWPGGDVRSVSGSVSGSSVTLNVQGGDVWRMNWSGNQLNGTAAKLGGGSYSLSFSR